MATPDQIAQVRRNTNESTQEPFADDLIWGLIDDLGSVEAASASIWEQKAASYSELVNVSEAGASRALGDLYKNALSMADRWRAKAEPESTEDAPRRARVTKIVRS